MRELQFSRPMSSARLCIRRAPTSSEFCTSIPPPCEHSALSLPFSPLMLGMYAPAARLLQTSWSMRACALRTNGLKQSLNPCKACQTQFKDLVPMAILVACSMRASRCLLCPLQALQADLPCGAGGHAIGCYTWSCCTCECVRATVAGRINGGAWVATWAVVRKPTKSGNVQNGYEHLARPSPPARLPGCLAAVRHAVQCLQGMGGAEAGRPQHDLLHKHQGRWVLRRRPRKDKERAPFRKTRRRRCKRRRQG